MHPKKHDDTCDVNDTIVVSYQTAQATRKPSRETFPSKMKEVQVP